MLTTPLGDIERRNRKMQIFVDADARKRVQRWQKEK